MPQRESSPEAEAELADARRDAQRQAAALEAQEAREALAVEEATAAALLLAAEEERLGREAEAAARDTTGQFGTADEAVAAWEEISNERCQDDYQHCMRTAGTTGAAAAACRSQKMCRR